MSASLSFLLIHTRVDPKAAENTLFSCADGDADTAFPGRTLPPSWPRPVTTEVTGTTLSTAFCRNGIVSLSACGGKGRRRCWSTRSRHYPRIVTDETKLGSTDPSAAPGGWHLSVDQ